VYAGGAAGGGENAGALVAGPTSHACLGATAGASYTGAAGAAAAISAEVGARPERPRGASVRDRAALTLCSIWERRDEYIDRFSVDL